MQNSECRKDLLHSEFRILHCASQVTGRQNATSPANAAAQSHIDTVKGTAIGFVSVTKPIAAKSVAVRISTVCVDNQRRRAGSMCLAAAVDATFACVAVPGISSQCGQVRHSTSLMFRRAPSRTHTHSLSGCCAAETAVR